MRFLVNLQREDAILYWNCTNPAQILISSRKSNFQEILQDFPHDISGGGGKSTQREILLQEEKNSILFPPPQFLYKCKKLLDSHPNPQD